MVGIIVFIFYAFFGLIMLKLSIKEAREEVGVVDNNYEKQDHENPNDDYGKIHPEYLGLIKGVLDEKEEKELQLNSIKLLNRELESVKKIDKEIEYLLKIE